MVCATSVTWFSGSSVFITPGRYFSDEPVLALSALLVGCDREVSSTKSSSESSDGTVKSKETSVSKSSDGTVTKTEETKKTTPAEKP